MLVVYYFEIRIHNLFIGFFFFFKQKTAYEMRISDWSSDVCSSDLKEGLVVEHRVDRVVEQLAAGRGDERRDERVEVGDPVALHHRLQRHFDAPDAARRQGLSGARFEHGHQYAIGRIAAAPTAPHGLLPPARLPSLSAKHRNGVG